MTNKNIEDLTNKNTEINIDEISPEELDQVAGGVNVEGADEEMDLDCGKFECGKYD